MFTHESRENYLERILMLKQKQEVVRSVDLAREMGFSKASISRAVKQLRENRYIVVEKDGNINFTKRGEEYARKIYERHEFFTEFLLFLGVDENTAREDACKLEHALSVDSFRAIKEYIQDAKKCIDEN